MPLALGFGFSRPEHVRAVGACADAAVVGSALVEVIAEHGQSPALLGRSRAVRAMAAELSLEALRDEIDKIDEVIVRLLDRRARCAYAIGRLKKDAGLADLRAAREAAVIAHVKRA